MKKTILKITTGLAFLFLGTTMNAQSDNGLIAKAKHAAADCISEYTSQGVDVAASIETTGICFVSGELHQVSFYTTVKCHRQPCPKPASVLVATVYFDCDDNITLVECN